MSADLRPAHVEPVRVQRIADVLGLRRPEGDPPALTGVTLDSRAVRPGDLYAALPGAHTHGARFVEQARRAGAVAVLTDPAGARVLAGLGTDAPEDPPSYPAGASEDPGTDGPVVLVHQDPRSVLGAVAAEVYGHPARDLVVCGVTGTNGKTTTAFLLEAALRAGGRRTGLVGTVETRIGDQRVASVRTTPEAPDLHALLAVMRERGVDAVALEVSSHALALGRVDGVVFDVAGFTQLSRDHLDFHPDLEAYFQAKASLFTPERTRHAVVTVDDVHGRRLAEQVRATGAPPRWTLSLSDPTADWAPRGSATPAADGGTTIEVQVPDDDGLQPLHCPLPGVFNVANALLALVMAAAAGVPVADAAAGIAATPGVPGRMERVGGRPNGPLCVVDYAHTPDAVATVLDALRPGTTGRLVVVLGAGGDRDREKRALMGAAAARGADRVVVTDDNPRSETPATIRAAVLAGARGVPGVDAVEVVEVADRRDAIAAAVGSATAGDTVVVLGKGHEQGQEVAGVVHPFDDRAVVASVLTSTAPPSTGTVSG